MDAQRTEVGTDAVDAPARTVGVLVVDDQPRFRDVARAVVERCAGFVVAGEAADGDEALRVAERTNPALVLMDIHMPVLDGIEACTRLVAAAPSIVVVLLSSYDREDLPERARHCPAAAYLHKEELSASALSALWAAHGA